MYSYCRVCKSVIKVSLLYLRSKAEEKLRAIEDSVASSQSELEEKIEELQEEIKKRDEKLQDSNNSVSLVSGYKKISLR